MNFSPQNVAYCFPNLKTLIEACGFSKSTIYKYINILKNCNMIYTYSLGNFICFKPFSIASAVVFPSAITVFDTIIPPLLL